MVEAGEQLGFLPGDVAQKLNPYMRPIYDALGDLVVGTASGRRVDDGAYAIKRLYLRRVAQGRGLGVALLRALLEHAGDATRLRLEVEPRNHRALEFYRRRGFTARCAPGDCNGMGAGLDSVVMERPWRGSL